MLFVIKTFIWIWNSNNLLQTKWLWQNLTYLFFHVMCKLRRNRGNFGDIRQPHASHWKTECHTLKVFSSVREVFVYNSASANLFSSWIQYKSCKCKFSSLSGITLIMYKIDILAIVNYFDLNYIAITAGTRLLSV